MIRRLTLAALAGLFCVAAVVDTASALTRAQAICVRGARSNARDALKASRADIQKQLNDQYGICLNDSTQCVPGCVNTQTACLSTPKAEVKACTDAPDTGCKAVNQVATNACRNAAPANQVACVEAAQLALFTCTQDCVAQHQDEVITCNGQFNDCLETCSQ